MTWTWQYENAAGEPVSGPEGSFPTQSDAETWLGEAWRDLFAQGVDQVVLREDDRTAYGPMSLHPQE